MILLVCVTSRLTVVSREAKKKQAVRDEHASELFTRSTALKFVKNLVMYRLDHIT